MAELKIKTNTGKDAGTLALSDAVFGVKPNLHCIRAALDGYRANQRLGTHATKTRGFVSGGGKKPWKQKGTGRARQGSTRAVQWRGGAISFGPSPRDYTVRINQKVRANAIRSALSEFAGTGKLFGLQDPKLDAPKTKAVADTLKAVGAQGRVLLIVDRADANLHLSTRNMADVTCLPIDNINIYDLLTHDCVVATQSAIKRLEEVYA